MTTLVASSFGSGHALPPHLADAAQSDPSVLLTQCLAHPLHGDDWLRVYLGTGLESYAHPYGSSGAADNSSRKRRAASSSAAGAGRSKIGGGYQRAGSVRSMGTAASLVSTNHPLASLQSLPDKMKPSVLPAYRHKRNTMAKWLPIILNRFRPGPKAAAAANSHHHLHGGVGGGVDTSIGGFIGGASPIGKAGLVGDDSMGGVSATDGSGGVDSAAALPLLLGLRGGLVVPTPPPFANGKAGSATRASFADLFVLEEGGGAPSSATTTNGQQQQQHLSYESRMAALAASARERRLPVPRPSLLSAARDVPFVGDAAHFASLAILYAEMFYHDGGEADRSAMAMVGGGGGTSNGITTGDDDNLPPMAPDAERYFWGDKQSVVIVTADAIYVLGGYGDAEPPSEEEQRACEGAVKASPHYSAAHGHRHRRNYPPPPSEDGSVASDKDGGSSSSDPSEEEEAPLMCFANRRFLQHYYVRRCVPIAAVTDFCKSSVTNVVNVQCNISNGGANGSSSASVGAGGALIGSGKKGRSKGPSMRTEPGHFFDLALPAIGAAEDHQHVDDGEDDPNVLVTVADADVLLEALAGAKKISRWRAELAKAYDEHCAVSHTDASGNANGGNGDEGLPPSALLRRTASTVSSVYGGGGIGSASANNNKTEWEANVRRAQLFTDRLRARLSTQYCPTTTTGGSGYSTIAPPAAAGGSQHSSIGGSTAGGHAVVAAAGAAPGGYGLTALSTPAQVLAAYTSRALKTAVNGPSMADIPYRSHYHIKAPSLLLPNPPPPQHLHHSGIAGSGHSVEFGAAHSQATAVFNPDADFSPEALLPIATLHDLAAAAMAVRLAREHALSQLRTAVAAQSGFYAATTKTNPLSAPASTLKAADGGEEGEVALLRENVRRLEGEKAAMLQRLASSTSAATKDGTDIAPLSSIIAAGGSTTATTTTALLEAEIEATRRQTAELQRQLKEAQSDAARLEDERDLLKGEVEKAVRCVEKQNNAVRNFGEAYPKFVTERWQAALRQFIAFRGAARDEAEAAIIDHLSTAASSTSAANGGTSATNEQQQQHNATTAPTVVAKAIASRIFGAPAANEAYGRMVEAFDEALAVLDDVQRDAASLMLINVSRKVTAIATVGGAATSEQNTSSYDFEKRSAAAAAHVLTRTRFKIGELHSQANNDHRSGDATPRQPGSPSATRARGFSVASSSGAPAVGAAGNNNNNNNKPTSSLLTPTTAVAGAAGSSQIINYGEVTIEGALADVERHNAELKASLRDAAAMIKELSDAHSAATAAAVAAAAESSAAGPRAAVAAAEAEAASLREALSAAKASLSESQRARDAAEADATIASERARASELRQKEREGELVALTTAAAAAEAAAASWKQQFGESEDRLRLGNQKARVEEATLRAAADEAERLRIVAEEALKNSERELKKSQAALAAATADLTEERQRNEEESVAATNKSFASEDKARATERTLRERDAELQGALERIADLEAAEPIAAERAAAALRKERQRADAAAAAEQRATQRADLAEDNAATLTGQLRQLERERDSIKTRLAEAEETSVRRRRGGRSRSRRSATTATTDGGDNDTVIDDGYYSTSSADEAVRAEQMRLLAAENAELKAQWRNEHSAFQMLRQEKESLFDVHSDLQRELAAREAAEARLDAKLSAVLIEKEGLTARLASAEREAEAAKHEKDLATRKAFELETQLGFSVSSFEEMRRRNAADRAEALRIELDHHRGYASLSRDEHSDFVYSILVPAHRSIAHLLSASLRNRAVGDQIAEARARTMKEQFANVEGALAEAAARIESLESAADLEQRQREHEATEQRARLRAAYAEAETSRVDAEVLERKAAALQRRVADLEAEGREQLEAQKKSLAALHRVDLEVAEKRLHSQQLDVDRYKAETEEALADLDAAAEREANISAALELKSQELAAAFDVVKDLERELESQGAQLHDTAARLAALQKSIAAEYEKVSAEREAMRVAVEADRAAVNEERRRLVTRVFADASTEVDEQIMDPESQRYETRIIDLQDDIRGLTHDLHLSAARENVLFNENSTLKHDLEEAKAALEEAIEQMLEAEEDRSYMQVQVEKENIALAEAGEWAELMRDFVFDRREKELLAEAAAVRAVNAELEAHVRELVDETALMADDLLSTKTAHEADAALLEATRGQVEALEAAMEDYEEQRAIAATVDGIRESWLEEKMAHDECQEARAAEAEAFAESKQEMETQIAALQEELVKIESDEEAARSQLRDELDATRRQISSITAQHHAQTAIAGRELAIAQKTVAKLKRTTALMRAVLRDYEISEDEYVVEEEEEFSSDEDDEENVREKKNKKNNQRSDDEDEDDDEDNGDDAYYNGHTNKGNKQSNRRGKAKDSKPKKRGGGAEDEDVEESSPDRTTALSDDATTNIDDFYRTGTGLTATTDRNALTAAIDALRHSGDGDSADAIEALLRAANNVSGGDPLASSSTQFLRTRAKIALIEAKGKSHKFLRSTLLSIQLDRIVTWMRQWEERLFVGGGAAPSTLFGGVGSHDDGHHNDGDYSDDGHEDVSYLDDEDRIEDDDEETFEVTEANASPSKRASRRDRSKQRRKKSLSAPAEPLFFQYMTQREDLLLESCKALLRGAEEAATAKAFAHCASLLNTSSEAAAAVLGLFAESARDVANVTTEMTAIAHENALAQHTAEAQQFSEVIENLSNELAAARADADSARAIAEASAAAHGHHSDSVAAAALAGIEATAVQLKYDVARDESDGRRALTLWAQSEGAALATIAEQQHRHSAKADAKDSEVTEALIRSDQLAFELDEAQRQLSAMARDRAEEGRRAEEALSHRTEELRAARRQLAMAKEERELDVRNAAFERLEWQRRAADEVRSAVEAERERGAQRAARAASEERRRGTDALQQQQRSVDAAARGGVSQNDDDDVHHYVIVTKPGNVSAVRSTNVAGAAASTSPSNSPPRRYHQQQSQQQGAEGAAHSSSSMSLASRAAAQRVSALALREGEEALEQQAAVRGGNKERTVSPSPARAVAQQHSDLRGRSAVQQASTARDRQQHQQQQRFVDDDEDDRVSDVSGSSDTEAGGADGGGGWGPAARGEEDAEHLRLEQLQQEADRRESRRVLAMLAEANTHNSQHRSPNRSRSETADALRYRAAAIAASSTHNDDHNDDGHSRSRSRSHADPYHQSVAAAAGQEGDSSYYHQGNTTTMSLANGGDYGGGTRSPSASSAQHGHLAAHYTDRSYSKQQQQQYHYGDSAADTAAPSVDISALTPNTSGLGMVGMGLGSLQAREEDPAPALLAPNSSGTVDCGRLRQLLGHMGAERRKAIRVSETAAHIGDVLRAAFSEAEERRQFLESGNVSGAFSANGGVNGTFSRGASTAGQLNAMPPNTALLAAAPQLQRRDTSSPAPFHRAASGAGSNYSRIHPTTAAPAIPAHQQQMGTTVAASVAAYSRAASSSSFVGGPSITPPHTGTVSPHRPPLSGGGSGGAPPAARAPSPEQQRLAAKIARVVLDDQMEHMMMASSNHRASGSAGDHNRTRTSAHLAYY